MTNTVMKCDSCGAELDADLSKAGINLHRLYNKAKEEGWLIIRTERSNIYGDYGDKHFCPKCKGSQNA